jgi:cell shape-determining protein MreC
MRALGIILAIKKSLISMIFKKFGEFFKSGIETTKDRDDFEQKIDRYKNRKSQVADDVDNLVHDYSYKV